MISITVPNTYMALTRAADFFTAMASDADSSIVDKVSVDTGGLPKSDTITCTHGEQVVEMKPKAKPPVVELPDKIVDGDTLTADEVFNTPKHQTTSHVDSGVTDTAQNATPDTTATELDVANLPHDNRIHSRGKTKLETGANAGKWRMKRKDKNQTDEQWSEFVTSVENELRQLMAVPQGEAGLSSAITNLIKTPSIPAPPPLGNDVSGADAHIQPQADIPAPAVLPNTAQVASAIASLPQLLAAITASGIDNASVTTACNNAGVASIPLLGARPDLVPVVAAELGL